jgi:hypothetical protein
MVDTQHKKGRTKRVESQHKKGYILKRVYTKKGEHKGRWNHDIHVRYKMR